jgi:superfamily II DNA or RNA helicase
LLSSPALNVGVDFPSVGLTINAAAGSGKIGITQKTGRGVRADKSGRKTRAVQVDFWDEEPYFYNNQARKRLAHLNSLYPECSKVVTVEELYDEFKLGRDTSSS